MLKKNTVQLEKDAINDNIFYISFNYMSLSKFNVKIFFNACENSPEKKNEKNDLKDLKDLKEKDFDEKENINKDNKDYNYDLIDININEADSKKNFKQ